MFLRIDNIAEDDLVAFEFEGRPLKGRAGEPVAAALLANGIHTTRTSVVSDEKRGPFCMMGVCFECLVQIDQRLNVQACMTALESGMKVRRQHGSRTVEAES